MFLRVCLASLWAVSMLAIMSPVRADDAPLVESRVDLFRGGDGAYESYRIPGLVVTARGTVIAYCEARKHPRVTGGRLIS